MPTLTDRIQEHDFWQAGIAPIAAAKIMIVDDDPTAMELICGQLEGLGCRELCACEDPYLARQRLDESRPDLLLLDVVMPGIGGLDILGSLRGSELWARLPVIILTAADDSETRIRALELGATDFLNKPANLIELACRIRNALLVHEYQSRLERQAEDLQRQVDLQTASLKESYEALKHTNVLLHRSCQEAEAATRAKSEFLATVSHEIRTPLTAIVGFTEELLSDMAEESLPADAPDMLQTVERNARHLLTIVNDVLDMAKIEKGKLAVDRVPCSPKAIFAEVAQLMQQQARAKGLEFVTDTAGAIPEVILSDPTRLKQILINLLGNAIKFTERGTIRLVMQSQCQSPGSPKLQFTVSDTGRGIPDNQLAAIFQPFVQAHTAISSGGTGLGLSITKYLVEELGGRIQVQSRPGEGSTFRITIAAKAVGDAQEPRDGTVDLPPDDIFGCRILLAEDGPDNQRLIRRILEKAGATVATAEDGQIAFDMLTECQRRGGAFDVILTDMQMPVLNGYELTQRLRADGFTGPIICLTANVLQGEQERCLVAGCDAYLSKPIDRAALIAMIARFYRK